MFPQASLLERVRAALAPGYLVERELASGGMGIVYLARDPHLDRRVAIKILRPEIATAVMAERFLREARTLAKLSHPNIVPIHQAGEADGIFYYVMDFLEGQPLDQRLAEGPLEPTMVAALGNDLLAALEAVHRRGLVHRDIKPANIILVGGRAVLGDFGIARSLVDTSTGLTVPGQIIGTPEYMAPEQLAGEPATAQTDLYALGLVLFEASTGRRWSALTTPEKADWRGVTTPMERALRRALPLGSAERWASAREFRNALDPAGRWRLPAAVAVGAVVVGLGWYAAVRRREPAPINASVVAVGPFETQGNQAWRALVDSLTPGVVERLAGHPDFRVVPGGATSSSGSVPVLTLRGRVEDRNGAPWLVPSLVNASGLDRPSPAVRLIPGAWQAQADSLRDLVEDELWTGALAKDRYLPRDALPGSRTSRILWQQAERLYARSRWSEADAIYREAVRDDSTCLLCDLRIVDVDRWLSLGHEPSRIDRLRRNRATFPPQYQLVLTANDIPWPERRDTLEAITKRFPDFFIGWYLLGDEIFHRGPLYGRAQRQGLQELEKAVQLNPGFSPGWNHIAWLNIVEGDSAAARAAIEKFGLLSGGVRTGIEMAEAQLLQLGFAWRFDRPGIETQTAAALKDPSLRSLPDFAAGPRMMPTFGAPRGAIELGRMIEGDARSDLQWSGGLAQVLGYLELGRPDSVRAIATRLRGRGVITPENELFLTEIEGAMVLLDPDSAGGGWGPVDQRLSDLLAPGAAPLDVQLRAHWVAALGAIQQGRPASAAAARAALGRAPPYRGLATMLEAATAAAGGDLARALALSAAISDAFLPDPILRTAAHLLRASWYDRLGNRLAARRELIWYANQDLNGFPSGPLQAAEVDWAFGTLAQWRLAGTPRQESDRSAERCAALLNVDRLWRAGEPRFQLRADSARVLGRSLGCKGIR